MRQSTIGLLAVVLTVAVLQIFSSGLAATEGQTRGQIALCVNAAARYTMMDGGSGPLGSAVRAYSALLAELRHDPDPKALYKLESQARDALAAWTATKTPSHTGTANTADVLPQSNLPDPHEGEHLGADTKSVPHSEMPEGTVLLASKSFDGSTDSEVLTARALDPSSSFTMAVWIRTSRTGKQTLLSTGRSPKWGDHGRSFLLYDCKLTFDIYNVGTYKSATKLCDGYWHHLAYVHRVISGTVVLELYADGDQVYTSSLPRASGASGASATIGYGYEHPKNQFYFGGDMRAMMWWPSALQSTVIAAVMEASAPTDWEHIKAVQTAPPNLPSSQWCLDHDNTHRGWAYMYCDLGPGFMASQIAAREDHEKLTKATSDPVVSIGMPATTRGISNPSFHTLMLFTKTLPAILVHLDPGFEYWIYLTHDVGDAWFDASGRHEEIRAWFQEHMVGPAKVAGLTMQLAILHFKNMLHKPGPVFNYMMASMYADGADYMYRVNDDTVFTTKFARACVDALASFTPANIGVVGPKHRGGNTFIMTHDFVHRSHMEIFNGLYYPTRFISWYMDDWISFVYGNENSAQLKQVQVVHQFAKHGTRYAVDYDVDTSIMEQELVGGRALAIDYVQKSGGDSSTLRQSSVRWRSEEIVDHGMGSKDFQQNLTLDWDNLISTQKLPNLPVQ